MNLRYAVLFALVVLAIGCTGGGEDVAQVPAGADAGPAIELQVEAPEPMAEPEYKTPASDTDWQARVNNKNIEIIQILNIINPIAAYIITGFEQYGDRFDATLHEEWGDTQVQLGSATTLYDDCQTRMEAGNFDKKLFLDMEEVWQLLVKTGVAGVRTKSMIDEALGDIAG